MAVGEQNPDSLTSGGHLPESSMGTQVPTGDLLRNTHSTGHSPALLTTPLLVVKEGPGLAGIPSQINCPHANPQALISESDSGGSTH